MKTNNTQNRIQKCLAFATFVLAGLVAITATSKAQTAPSSVFPPESLPIASRGEIRTRAIEQVAGSRLSIFGETIMWNSNSTTDGYFHPEKGTNVDEALRIINKTIFDFVVTDKSKQLGVWGELHNSIGMALFYGYKPVSVSQNGRLLYDVFNLEMNPQMPIYVGEGVERATIKTDEGWLDVSAWNGYIFFPLDYTGKEGMLVLQYTDGNLSQEIGYSLRSGSKLPLYNVTGSIGVRLPDFQYITDSGLTANSEIYIDGTGYVGDGHQPPVVSFKLTSNRGVRFYSAIYTTVDYSLIENPVVGWYYKKGDKTKNPVNLYSTEWSTPVTLPPGEYFFYPETGLYESPQQVTRGEKGE